MLEISFSLTFYIIAVTFVTGLVMGSFANCLSCRLVTGESIFKGRSHCPHCSHVLSAGELIPVFSWLFQKGRCRHCSNKISPRYPLSELAAALMFVGVILVYDVTAKAFMFLVLSVILLVVALHDFDCGLIPNSMLIAGIVNFLVFTVIIGGDLPKSLLNGLIGGLSVSLPLFLFTLIFNRIIKKESMGGGDIKLFFVLGLYFDWKLNLFMLILSCILGILFYFVYSAVNKVKGFDKPFPFGPAISAACLLTAFFGTQFMNFYLSFFNL